MREDYDYVWEYNTPRFARSLDAVGKLVYEDGDLEVHQMNRLSEGSSARGSPAK